MAETDPAELGVPTWALDGVRRAEPNRRLEGLLAPGTYDIAPGTGAREALAAVVDEVADAWAKARLDPTFDRELQALHRTYTGRPSILTEVPRFAKHAGGARVLLKREDQQPGFSFKLRGAYNKMAQLAPEQLARGVICASAGNHAQGVALSASRLGCKALIVMPTTTPQVKIDAVRARGGERTPPVGPSERQFLGMLDEFALAVRENREPRTPGLMGLRDVHAMERIYEAARSGRPVAVPPVG